MSGIGDRESTKLLLNNPTRVPGSTCSSVWTWCPWRGLLRQEPPLVCDCPADYQACVPLYTGTPGWASVTRMLSMTQTEDGAVEWLKWKTSPRPDRTGTRWGWGSVVEMRPMSTTEPVVWWCRPSSAKKRAFGGVGLNDV